MGWTFSRSQGSVGFGTALPGSPVDGDEFTLVDSTTAPTWSWQLRYVAAKASNKWIFVGGSPGYAEVTTNETTTSTTYVALATAGPNFAIPVAGDYLVTQGFLNQGYGAARASTWMSYDIGGTGAVDADATRALGVDSPNDSEHSVTRTRKKSLTAVTLTSKYRCSAGTQGFQDRWIRVQPVAIGG